MKEIFKKSLRGLLVVPLLALSFSFVAGFVAQPAYAGDYNLSGGPTAAKGDEVPEELVEGDEGVFKTIVNVLLFIIGAVAVIMLIIGGIRYTTSNGDSNQVTAAKNTILYAIVGIIVAILAYAIVNFVLGAFTEA